MHNQSALAFIFAVIENREDKPAKSLLYSKFHDFYWSFAMTSKSEDVPYTNIFRE